MEKDLDRRKTQPFLMSNFSRSLGLCIRCSNASLYSSSFCELGQSWISTSGILCFHMTSSFFKIKIYQFFWCLSFISYKRLYELDVLQCLNSTWFFVFLWRTFESLFAAWHLNGSRVGQKIKRNYCSSFR